MTSRWTDYDLTRAWEDGWRTCLQDKEPAIRADERAKCRAELRDKLEELINPKLSYRDAVDRWIAVWDWSRKEAFGGE